MAASHPLGGAMPAKSLFFSPNSGVEFLLSMSFYSQRNLEVGWFGRQS